MTLQELIALHGDAPGAGLEAIPRVPGIYLVFNRLTGRGYVGSALNLRTRCQGHINGLKRGQTYNGLMRRDLEKHGPDGFACCVLETFPSTDETDRSKDLVWLENAWILELGTDRESVGYNALVNGEWTKGATFRDRERKLMRKLERYCLIKGVDLYDPIADILLNSWTREPRLFERPYRGRRRGNS
jgi:group I intron endonuclease